MPKLATTRITDTLVERARPKDKIFEIRDAGQRGLILRVYPSGLKKWIVQYAANRRETFGDASLIKVKTAQIRARKLLSEFDPNRPTGPASKLKDYLNKQYQNWMEKRSVHAERDLNRLVSALGGLAEVKLDKLTHAGIDRWVQDRDVAPATVNRELASLKAALNRAVEWNLIDINPAQRVKALKNQAGKVVRFLDHEERERLMNALDGFDQEYIKVMVHLVSNTGLRRGEVFALEWRDINLESDVPMLHVRAATAKSSKDRYVPLNRDAVTKLKAWRIRSGVRDGLIFTGPKGGKISSIRWHWDRLMKLAEIQNFRFHDLRHDFASRLVQAGRDLYIVKDLLGHSTIQLTERYAHLKPQNLVDAVRMLETNNGDASQQK